MKLIVYYIGKPRDRHANAMAAEFVKRASRWARIEMHEVQPRRGDPTGKHTAVTRIALDPSGDPVTSAGFADLVRSAEMEGRDVVFLVGGAEGLPDEWRQGADWLLSLTPLTLPHELARVVLAEQIYRALATLRGHPYPR